MKRFITALLVLSLMGCVHAQNIVATSYIERTTASPKFGSTVGYQFKSMIELGGFIQRSQEFMSGDGQSLSRMHEREFMGAYADYPITRGLKTELDFRVRMGVTNRENFIITPSIHGHYNITRLFSIGAGIGTRAFLPTFMANLKLNLGGLINKNTIAEAKTPL